MFKVVIHQILNTLVKDVTFYLENYDSCLNVSEQLVKDPSVLNIIIYKDDQIIKKFKNEINFIKYYGK